ncbi:MAG: peroxiredoxin family protein [Gemmataceae bacterium]
MRPFLCLLCVLLGCWVLSGCRLFLPKIPKTPTHSEEDIGPDVGQLAPDIRRLDADGVPMVLSDHRGKVVMLVFWADRSPAARTLYSQYSSLLERMHGRPFVMLGVNRDSTRKQFLRARRDDRITWPSWYDVRGAIAEAYRVEEIPTVVLIGGDGIIRYRDVFDKELERAVEVLVTKLEEGVER